MPLWRSGGLLFPKQVAPFSSPRGPIFPPGSASPHSGGRLFLGELSSSYSRGLLSSSGVAFSWAGRLTFPCGRWLLVTPGVDFFLGELSCFLYRALPLPRRGVGFFLVAPPFPFPGGASFATWGCSFSEEGCFVFFFRAPTSPLWRRACHSGGSTFCTVCFLFSLGGSLCPSVLPLFRSGRLPANLYRAAAPLSHRGVGFCSKKFAFSFERLTFPLQRHLFVTWGVCISPRRVVCFALSGRVTFFLP